MPSMQRIEVGYNWLIWKEKDLEVVTPQKEDENELWDQSCHFTSEAQSKCLFSRDYFLMYRMKRIVMSEETNKRVYIKFLAY